MMRKYIFTMFALIICLFANAQRSIEPYGRSHVIVYDDAYCRNSATVDEVPQYDYNCSECEEINDVSGTVRETTVHVNDLQITTVVHHTKQEVRHVYVNDNSYRYDNAWQSRCPQHTDAPIWNINFEIDSSNFSNHAWTNLRNVYQYWRSNRVRIQILGYADRYTGTNEYNYRLSKIRANKVADALIQLGVNRQSIIVEYEGDYVQPYPYNNDWNRCVRIKVIR